MLILWFVDSDENHDPIVVFGDSFFVNQKFYPSSQGDYEENMIIPSHSISANHVDPWDHNWGNTFPNAAAIGWTGFCNNEWNIIAGSGHAGYASWIGGWNYSHNPHNFGVEPANVTEGRTNGVQGYGT
ncbi:unnamed protein product [Fraxinus pennsylvanica]|uniref:Uncharacterized protein n=1 Tax=Fraxinus pennsylvanica TaxID=56036 RepID=A0AAD2A6W3_9LAMI|nr:unnamed protein product [Fraxinus pennsylvanica]